MLYSVKRIWNPEMFQGHGKRKKYFEGWYYKIVDRDGENSMAIIPGISINNSHNSSHSFIQVIEGKTCESHYIRYELEEFQYSKRDFDIRIGKNLFSADRIVLNVDDKSFSVKGELRFEGLTPWPVTCLSPGIMGWYTFVPRMECYHGVISMDHRISGIQEVNGHGIDYTEGRGYIEKDWGTSFPKGWVWLQSNHFSRYGTAFTGSIARIPWMKGQFIGFIIGFLHNKRLYRFATYTGAKLQSLSIDGNSVKAIVSDKKYVLEIEALKKGGSKLYSPIYGAMDGRIDESLQSIVNIRLSEKLGKRKSLIADDIGHFAGMEITNGEVLTEGN